MFKHQVEIVHHHGNGYRDWLFQWQRIHDLWIIYIEIGCFNGKGFTIDGLFTSLFTEL